MKIHFSKESYAALTGLFASLAAREQSRDKYRLYKKLAEKFIGERQFVPLKPAEAALILAILTMVEEHRDSYKNQSAVLKLMDAKKVLEGRANEVG